MKHLKNIFVPIMGIIFGIIVGRMKSGQEALFLGAMYFILLVILSYVWMKF